MSEPCANHLRTICEPFGTYALSINEHDAFWTDVCVLVENLLLECQSVTSAFGVLSAGAWLVS